jgi:hypothetical protein
LYVARGARAIASSSEIALEKPLLWLKSRNKPKMEVIVAPPIGLEPMTDWLTASRSTWLSYGGSCVTLSFDFCGLI